MSQQAVLPPREDGYQRKKWTVSDCRFLAASGLLEPGKYELIEGEIVSKMGQGRRHIAVVSRIIARLSVIFGGNRIQSQAQIGIGELDQFNDPEPDVTVVRGDLSDYLDHEPLLSEDVLLAVEASDSSLHGDITVKARIYARHWVPEYWVVAIPRRELIVFRSPGPDGYTDVRTYGEAESVAPLSAPDSLVRVGDLLP